jgi:hypothetical protein
MSEKTIKEIILPQQFSSNGIRIDELAAPVAGVVGSLFPGYGVLFNFFVEEGGFGYKGVIYATDIAKLKSEFKDADGKISLESARKMGLKGKDDELTAAIELMDELLLRELNPQESYPIKISANEQLNYNKHGQLYSRTFIGEDNEFMETVYDNGDTERIAKKYMRKADGTLHFVEYLPFDLSKIQMEAITAPNGIKIKRIYSYDNKNKLKSYYESGQNYYKTTLVDEYGRTVFTHETLGHLIKKIVHIYNDEERTVLQETEGDPRHMTEGIMRKKILYATQNGQKTDQVLSEVNIMMNGQAVQVS